MNIIIISLASTYLIGLLTSVGYKAARMSEMKKLYDVTRTKDTKNEAAAMTRFHFDGMKDSWLWPLEVLGWTQTLRWAKDLAKK